MADSDVGGIASRREVLKGFSAVGIAFAGGVHEARAQAPAPQGTPFNPSRWWTHDYRIVQTNLREIDVHQDPRQIARALKAFGANTIVSNIGGIVAFYPTELKYHYQNPYLRFDFVREMLAACRAEGIAYLGRFDISKGRRLAFEEHPEWFMRNRDGSFREYEGTWQACPNGGWGQDYSMQILREGLTRYKADGVFFNGVGFTGWQDYAGVVHGPCMCDNCRREFRRMYNLELPAVDGPADPNWFAYQEFTRRVTADLVARTRALADELIPGSPIMGAGVVSRGEVQRRIARPAPEWPYYAGEQIRAFKSANPATPVSATSAAHMDFPFRQVTETADLHINRFAQMLAYGGKLDLYLMGTLADQNDQTWLQPVSNLFKWEAANSRHYADLMPAARTGLYSGGGLGGASEGQPFSEYRDGAHRGATCFLIDGRIPFRTVRPARTEEVDPFRDLDVILVPHILSMSETEAAALDKWVSEGGLLVTTGMTGGFDPRSQPVDRIGLQCFPFESYRTPDKASGWTLDLAKSAVGFSTARMPVDRQYFGGVMKPGAQSLVPFAPNQRWGPPELSYAIPGDQPRSDPGVAAMAFGKGHAVHIPWLIDWQYYRDGLPIYLDLISALIARYAPPQQFTLTGDGAVELTVQRRGESGLLLHVINYGGQRNVRYVKPPTLTGLSLGVRASPKGSCQALVAGRTLRGVRRDGDAGRLWFDLPAVGAFEAISFDA